MQKMDTTQDYSGRKVERGDTVTTLNGHLTARVCDICSDGEACFVRLRPLHQPYGPGTWHAADRVIWVAAANRRRRKRKRRAKSAAGSNGESSGNGAAARPK